MSDLSLKQLARVYFAPPEFLALPTAGIDISTSSVKAVGIVEKTHGIEVAYFDNIALPDGAVVEGEIIKPEPVAKALKKLADKHGIKAAHVSLPESKSYLFESHVPVSHVSEWHTVVEQHIDEYVPIPPNNVIFDIAPLSKKKDSVLVVGVGYAKRTIDSALEVLDAANIEPRSLESETFAGARALFLAQPKETVLVVDIGKTTTKITVVEQRLPRFATTLGVGGDAFTLAIQKYFKVDEEAARKIKIEHGVVSSAGNEEYLSAMILTMSAIRDEVRSRFDYWQAHSCAEKECSPISRAIVVGGNATIRGLPEYLSSALNVSVELGDVFTNLASRDVWLPSINHAQSFAYTTAIGLALRDYAK